LACFCLSCLRHIQAGGHEARQQCRRPSADVGAAGAACVAAAELLRLPDMQLRLLDVTCQPHKPVVRTR